MRDHNAPQANGQGSSGGSGEAAAAAERVVHPVQQGVITNWDVLEACLDHVLYERVSWWRVGLTLPVPANCALQGWSTTAHPGGGSSRCPPAWCFISQPVLTASPPVVHVSWGCGLEGMCLPAQVMPPRARACADGVAAGQGGRRAGG